MAKPEWGLKRTCRDCGKRFYDFRRAPIVCPGCQAVFDPLALLRPRRARAAGAAPAARPEAVARREVAEAGRDDGDAADVAVEDEEIDDDAVIDSDDDDGMIKESSDLDGDDDLPESIDEEG